VHTFEKKVSEKMIYEAKNLNLQAVIVNRNKDDHAVCQAFWQIDGAKFELDTDVYL
jgi:hypothetical protein